jgi:formamidopyrimidine-DNA glycosylase
VTARPAVGRRDETNDGNVSERALVDEVECRRLHLTGAPGGATTLDFVDQRTFGYVAVVRLVPTPDGRPGGHGAADPAVPVFAAHVARDLLDPAVAHATPGRAALVAAIRRRRTGVKRALLDQGVVSGIGNIYADEALWRAGLHYARATDRLRPSDVERLLSAAEAVMREALAAGGTSFDALYVDVEGESGYFARALAAYGRAGEPCPRCATPIRRDTFMNRGAHWCPRCQPQPRGANARW